MILTKKGQISLNFGLKLPKDENTNTIYIVDEASLIGDRKSGQNSFASYGSDRLLSDLLDFDANGKFLFIGDSSQLPPIDGTFLPSSKRKVSPALTAKYIQEVFDYPVKEFALTEIKRQDEKVESSKPQCYCAVFTKKYECKMAAIFKSSRTSRYYFAPKSH